MTLLTAAWREGGRRTCAPSETWRRLAPLLPVFGISRLANITGLDRVGVPVYTAVRPNGRSLSVFQGKGLTRDAARVSAAMEAYETWCAETMTGPLHLASIEEMRFAHPIADVSRLPLADPAGPDPDLPFLWIEGREMRNGAPRWLPFEMVHANYALPEPAHSGAFSATTNGLASGNTPEEAQLHALMEVIERDATTLWKLSPGAWGSDTAVDPASVTDPACASVLGRFAEAGIETAIWDIRSDLGIPAFYCLITDPSGETGAAELGAGAHMAPEVALLRALTEAAQARCTYIAGAREDILDEDYGDDAVAERRAMAEGLVRGLKPTRSFADIESRETATLASDIAATLERLETCGMAEAIAVDLSRKGLPFAVQRVVVPGLEAAFEGPRSDYVPGARAGALLGEAP
ncbi:MAG: YcaO-like family protein [Pseudomonadota bacterium]